MQLHQSCIIRTKEGAFSHQESIRPTSSSSSLSFAIYINLYIKDNNGSIHPLDDFDDGDDDGDYCIDED
jgi:hypothetical protein